MSNVTGENSICSSPKLRQCFPPIMLVSVMPYLAATNKKPPAGENRGKTCIDCFLVLQWSKSETARSPKLYIDPLSVFYVYVDIAILDQYGNGYFCSTCEFENKANVVTRHKRRHVALIVYATALNRSLIRSRN